MEDRTFNIVSIRLVNNRVERAIETCTGLSITEAEQKVMDYAEDAIQSIKGQDSQTITITNRSVTIEIKDDSKTTTFVYTIVRTH